MKRIILFLFVITQLMFIGCAASNNSEMLLEEQKRAYDVVVEYAMSCLSVEEKQEILKQVEGDIKKAEEGKIEIEISIGKLKIDKLFLKEKLEKNIANEKLAAANNKFSYKTKRDSIKNIYYGDYTSYNNEIKKLQSEISQAYGNYTRQAIAIRNMGNITEGYRNTLLESAEI